MTHWWDASQIYGSDQATQNHLRSGVDGKLRLNPDGTLPLDKKGIEETGFVRNWWVGLTMLHTLFRPRTQRDLRSCSRPPILRGMTTGCSTWRA